MQGFRLKSATRIKDKPSLFEEEDSDDGGNASNSADDMLMEDEVSVLILPALWARASTGQLLASAGGFEPGAFRDPQSQICARAPHRMQARGCRSWAMRPRRARTGPWP